MTPRDDDFPHPSEKREKIASRHQYLPHRLAQPPWQFALCAVIMPTHISKGRPFETKENTPPRNESSCFASGSSAGFEVCPEFGQGPRTQILETSPMAMRPVAPTAGSAERSSIDREVGQLLKLTTRSSLLRFSETNHLRSDNFKTFLTIPCLLR